MGNVPAHRYFRGSCKPVNVLQAEDFDARQEYKLRYEIVSEALHFFDSVCFLINDEVKKVV